MLVTGLVTLYAGAFTIANPSTLDALLKLGTWSPLLGVLGILAIQALVSFAIIRYFLQHAPEHGHWWKTKLAPIIGGLAQIGACYLLIKYRGDLSGAGDNRRAMTAPAASAPASSHRPAVKLPVRSRM